MAASKALVKPKLLVWTRKRAKVRPEDAAKAANVDLERLEAWETWRGSPDRQPASAIGGEIPFPPRGVLSAGAAG